MMMPDLLSAEDSTKVLQNRFNRADVNFISLKLKPISENVEGFLGEHYNLFITYELDNKTDTELFFIKTQPTTSEIQIQMCTEMNAYKKEIFIYDILIKEFRKYGYDTSFVANSYYCVPDKSLILENLINKGFILSEKQTVFDLNKVKCTLKALALFHAGGFAYQETKAKELGNFAFEKKYAEFLEEVFFVFFTNPAHFTMTWWNSSLKTIKKIIDLLPENETYKTQFKNMLNSFPFGKVFVEETKFPKTCGHGDLWSNNMMFKQDNDITVECRLLDFQVCRYFYPSFDVMLAIYCNTSAEFRKAHLDELYQFYYKTLGDTLNNYGYSIQNILPLNDFYESIRITKADVLLQTTCAMSVVYLPTEMFTKAMKETETDGDALKKALFDNTDICCKAFTNDTRYRKIILNTLQEFRNALLALQ